MRFPNFRRPAPGLVRAAYVEVCRELVKRNGAYPSRYTSRTATTVIRQFAAYGEHDVERLKAYALAVLSTYAWLSAGQSEKASEKNETPIALR